MHIGHGLNLYILVGDYKLYNNLILKNFQKKKRKREYINSKLMLKECEGKWGNGLVNSNKAMDLTIKRGKWGKSSADPP